VSEAPSASLAPEGLAGDLESRHARITARLEAFGASCLVAIRDESITYLTGYTTMTWKMYSRPVVAVLATDGRLMVLTAETEADSARLRIPGAEVRAYVELEPVTEGMGLPDGRIQFAPHAVRVLAEMIEEAGPGQIAVDSLDAAWPPIGQLTRLIPGLDGRTTDASELVWSLRLRKSAWELDRMREAAAVLDRAYALLREQLRPGMTERDIARRFDRPTRGGGARGRAARGCRRCGPRPVRLPDRPRVGRRRPALPGRGRDRRRLLVRLLPNLRRPVASIGRARRLCPGEGGLGGGGRLEAGGTDRGRSGIDDGRRAGHRPGDVGFGRFGHGIGLHVPEPPSLHGDDPTPLEDGFTLCVEPAVEHAGLNFVVEEEHVLGAAGFERLSPPAPTDILVV
jgi:Xaa-Pro aminopeptidase